MTITITMTAMRSESINHKLSTINLHKRGQEGHWSLWSFTFSTSNNHKCRELELQPSGKVLHNRAECRTFALAIERQILCSESTKILFPRDVTIAASRESKNLHKIMAIKVKAIERNVAFVKGEEKPSEMEDSETLI